MKNIKLLLKRIFRGSEYTIGKLYVNDVYLCDTLEDCDRGLKQSMSIIEILKRKIKANTAIPTGIYSVVLNIISPKYSKRKYYMDLCQGKVPRLLDVPGYLGVLIHVGNTNKDTEGCILLGENKIKGLVINSRKTFEKFYDIIKDADNITIEIV